MNEQANRTKLLIATNNQGKLREYATILRDLPLDLVTLREVGIDVDIPETGQTFDENAIIKASGYAKLSGLCTLADDSGLEVAALRGEPGVRSARYAGPDATDADRVRFLLDKMRDVPQAARAARFVCVIAVATPRGRVETTSGTCEGSIAFAPRGTEGFGYDPIFVLPDKNKTMAEIPASVKNTISHRARAGDGVRAIITRLIDAGECV